VTKDVVSNGLRDRLDMTVSARALVDERHMYEVEPVFSGRGFLGLPQKGISVHVLKSEPSAIHHLRCMGDRKVYGTRWTYRIVI